MIRTAIVLAGGFGTRLQNVVKDVPKPMADIAGKPFLEYLLDYLLKQGIAKCILSVGYKWETIKKYFGGFYKTMDIVYSVEEEPLGTGGAILKAVKSSSEEEFFVLNGDTFFNITLEKFYEQHTLGKGVLSLALKPMTDFNRYGAVKTDNKNIILSFDEKRHYERGNINGGVYVLNRKLFEKIKLQQKFSFEKDVLERYFDTINFYGFPFDDYFIDIGIPEDYERAQKELPQLMKG